jgi:hypothetical protein
MPSRALSLLVLPLLAVACVAGRDRDPDRAPHGAPDAHRADTRPVLGRNPGTPSDEEDFVRQDVGCRCANDPVMAGCKCLHCAGEPGAACYCGQGKPRCLCGVDMPRCRCMHCAGREGRRCEVCPCDHADTRKKLGVE